MISWHSAIDLPLPEFSSVMTQIPYAWLLFIYPALDILGKRPGKLDLNELEKVWYIMQVTKAKNKTAIYCIILQVGRMEQAFERAKSTSFVYSIHS